MGTTLHMRQQIAPFLKALSVTAAFAVLLAVLNLSACATFKPGSLDQLTIRDRAVTLEKDGLRVSTAVLSRTEAKQLFGANLHKRGVQPVWLEIENKTDKPFWLMLHGIDPNYFSAHEVAYMNHIAFSGKANKEMDNFFADMGINPGIKPGDTQSGFAFSNETIGTKEVRVKLFSNKDVRDFTFFISIPGYESAWDKTDLQHVFAESELIRVETEQELFDALMALPCCTQRERGNTAGAPINVALIGVIASLKALIRAGWDETEFLTDLSTLFGAAYLYGRSPDIQFEKTRRRISSTTQLRLWLSPIRYKGKAVAVGSIMRDIDPKVDEAAIYLLEDLGAAGTVERFGFVGGVGKVSKDNPRKSLGNTPYWTKGNRIVLLITETPTALNDVTVFDWDWSEKRVLSTNPTSDHAAGQEH